MVRASRYDSASMIRSESTLAPTAVAFCFIAFGAPAPGVRAGAGEVSRPAAAVWSLEEEDAHPAYAASAITQKYDAAREFTSFNMPSIGMKIKELMRRSVETSVCTTPK